VFGEGAARGADACEHASFNGGGVGRVESEGSTNLKVRVGVTWALAEPPFGERPGALEIVVKLRRQLRPRRRAGHVGARLAQVVFDGDDALLEQQRDPDRGGRESIAGGIIGIGRDRLLERFERLS
jgi:hypothetical protein